VYKQTAMLILVAVSMNHAMFIIATSGRLIFSQENLFL